MAEPSTQIDLPDLCLPQSRLFFIGDKIIRRDLENNPIASLDLNSVREVRCKRSIDWGAVLFVFFCLLVLWAVSAYEMPVPWNFFIQVPLGLITFCTLAFALIETEVIVISESGEVSFPVSDAPTDAKAFVVSLKERLQAKQAVG
ncbi:hypothetical protein JNK13_11225 [bacterium]|nr:hypothetical protein [bacterium]